MSSPSRTAWLRAAILCGAALATVPAAAQLRIVDYNIAQNSTFNSNPTDLNTILTAIGNEVRNGFSRQIDIFADQELSEDGGDAAFIVGQLNTIYGAGTYAAAPIPGNAITGGNGLPSLIYNTHTVSLIDTLAFGNVGSGAAQQPRSTMRYQLRPVGYDASADFYVYNSHYKSDTGTVDQERRRIEAASIRDNSDLLGDGTHALYVGDYNIAGSTESMYVELMSSGPGQAFDPIATPGNWNGESFKAVHSQSPAVNNSPTPPAFPGQVLGGMNDRFDFQLITGEVKDTEGLDYIGGSYHVFGNNGHHNLNGPINVVPVGMSLAQPQNVLDALTRLSDHLPVVADYQLPAKMQVQVASVPPTVPVGTPVSIDVMVQNLVNAAAAAFGDELDYSLSVTGDLLGGASGVANALAAANTHAVSLNTSSPGPKSGVITVTSTSQGAANALFTLPVSFTVGGGEDPTPPNTTMRMPIARDDFDAPLNLSSYTQTPDAGAFDSPADGFERYQVGVSASIPFDLLDQTTSGSPTDNFGIIVEATKTDGWFGIADTENPDNPTGAATATWQFNVGGATALEVSVDMGAGGDFEGGVDIFNWTYALDGGSFQPLFSSSVDVSGEQTYTFANGHTATHQDPLSMTTTGAQTVTLSNVLQTLTSAISGTAQTLTLRLNANTNADDEAYAFDNIVVIGTVTFLASDFDKDGFVDADDLTAWRGGFGTASGATKAQGDANNDGRVDGTDFLVWQRQLGQFPTAMAASATVPEPSSVGAWLGIVTMLAGRRRRRGT